MALLVCQVALLLFGPPTSQHTALLAHVFTTANLWVIGFNLLPVEPLDGAKAWPLFRLLWQRRRRRSAPAAERRPSVESTLRDLERLETLPETPQERSDRIVRDLISRTTQSKRA